MFFVAKPHDLFIFTGCIGHQLRRKAVFSHNQRMITPYKSWGFYAGVKRRITEFDHRSFAVHNLACSSDLGTKGFGNRLVPKTHSEDGDSAGKFFYKVDRYPGLPWSARPRRYDYRHRLHGFDFNDGNFIIAEHLDLGPEHGQVLNEVVSKGIIIIDDCYHSSSS